MEQKPLKKFTSIHNVQVDDVLNILDEWEKGKIDEIEVFCFAEDLYYLGEWGWPQCSRENIQSILFAVLESLEMLYTQPTLQEDIPALKRFLQIGQENPLEAWKSIDDYWNSIDWRMRLKNEL